MESSSIKKSYDLIVVGLGISGLYLSYLASQSSLRVLALDQNSSSAAPLTASNGYSRRYHPTQGHDLDAALEKWKQLELAYEKGILLQEGSMLYMMKEVRGDFLKTFCSEADLP